MSDTDPPASIINRILNNGNSHYSTLGVLETASQDEINKAYKTIIMKLHPDRCKLKNTTAAFIKAGEAHEVLTDKNKKENYDRQRSQTGIFTTEELREIFRHERRSFIRGNSWTEFIRQNSPNNYNNIRFAFSQTNLFRTPGDIFRIFQRDLARRNLQNQNIRGFGGFDDFMRFYTLIILILILFKVFSFL
ncbi:Chaperone protein DnaJ [Cucumispora dikerogammari]|nr:Chaperone protein DnaJ [Cucumispora dikerogammari]